MIRPLHMLKAGLVALSCATVALVPPQPAAADNDDLARILAGLAIAGIALKAIEQGNRGHVTVHRDFRPRTHRPIVEPHRSHRAARRTLPRACLRDVVSQGRVTRVVATPCLRRQNVSAVLPATCRTRLHVNGRSANGYKVRCLRDRGYAFR